MRVISGKFRGKKLKSFEGQDIRPTSDRAKESIFNIINAKIEGSSFLDLFCGTGSMGIEALSRGAKNVVFVDADYKSVKLTNENLKSVKQDITALKCSAENYLLSCSQKFDIIFLDPPYAYDKVDSLINLIVKNNLLNKDGIIIYEHKSDRQSQNFDKLQLTDVRKYGIAVFDFYKVVD